MRLQHTPVGVVVQGSGASRFKVILAMDRVLERFGIPLHGIAVQVNNHDVFSTIRDLELNCTAKDMKNMRKKVAKNILKASDPLRLTGQAKKNFDNDLVILACLFHITSGEPMEVARVQMRNVECSVCCTVVERSKFCMGCMTTVYCSQECQRTDWSAHRSRCHPPLAGHIKFQ
jgi:hypothetical protein